MYALIAIFAALSTGVPLIVATPTRRATTFCGQLVVSCAASGPQAINDPWTIPACIYGATCFGGSRPVDEFLLAVATERNEPQSAKASLSVPSLTLEAFNKISTDKATITQQNFIDGVFSTLSATDGPYPDVSFVISSYQRINTWTRFCNGLGIPWRNFADYFTYSATISSSGCSSSESSTAVTITQATGTTSIQAPSTTFRPLPSSGSFTITYVSTTTVTGPVVSPSPPTYPIISSEASCQKTFETCARAVNYYLTDVWNFNACLLAATCIAGDLSVDTLLAVLHTTRTGNNLSSTPKSVNLPRLSESQFRKISSNGVTITAQNWIDAYYGLLASSGGPWPVSADVVIAYFRRVQSWTAFCGTGGIPYKNVADFFQYSSTVPSPNAC